MWPLTGTSCYPDWGLSSLINKQSIAVNKFDTAGNHYPRTNNVFGWVASWHGIYSTKHPAQSFLTNYGRPIFWRKWNVQKSLEAGNLQDLLEHFPNSPSVARQEMWTETISSPLLRFESQKNDRRRQVTGFVLIRYGAIRQSTSFGRKLHPS